MFYREVIPRESSTITKEAVRPTWEERMFFSLGGGRPFDTPDSVLKGVPQIPEIIDQRDTSGPSDATRGGVDE